MFAEAHLYPEVALAGLVSFLLTPMPCCPLAIAALPRYTAARHRRLTAEKGLETRVWRRVVIASVFFVLRFTTVFIAFAAKQLRRWASSCRSYRAQLGYVAGGIIILFGLHFLGLCASRCCCGKARACRSRWRRFPRAPTCLGSPSRSAGRLALGRSSQRCWRSLPTPTASVRAFDCSRSTRWCPACRSVLAAVAIRPFLSFMNRFKRHLGLMEKIMGACCVDRHRVPECLRLVFH